MLTFNNGSLIRYEIVEKCYCECQEIIRRLTVGVWVDVIQLLGVWFYERWLQYGSPENVNFVELGPGRGTLVSDILRVRISRQQKCRPSHNEHDKLFI